MAIPGLRLASCLFALGGALGCAAHHPGRLTVAPGCYALYADDWPAAAAIETGLRSLPSFIALDTATAGPRGRRVVLPTTWESEDPNRRSAYWAEGGTGEGSLVLTFLGPSGQFTAALQPARDGYIGEGVGLARGAARWPPEVHVSLVSASCAGLVPEPHPQP